MEITGHTMDCPTFKAAEGPCDCGGCVAEVSMCLDDEGWWGATIHTDIIPREFLSLIHISEPTRPY